MVLYVTVCVWDVKRLFTLLMSSLRKQQLTLIAGTIAEREYDRSRLPNGSTIENSLSSPRSPVDGAAHACRFHLLVLGTLIVSLAGDDLRSTWHLSMNSRQKIPSPLLTQVLS